MKNKPRIRMALSFSKILSHVLWSVCALIALLPVGVRATLGSLLGRAFAWIPTPDRRVALLQVRLALPEVTDPTTVVSDSYANLGRNVFEALDFRRLLDANPPLIIERDPSVLDSVAGSTRPVLLMTGHFGNWDLLAPLMQRRGFKLSVIGREARSPIFQFVLSKIRSRSGTRTIWRSDSPSAAKDIIRGFRSGETLGVLIDQDTRVESLFSPFFGLDASTPSTMVRIAKRHNAHIVGLLLRRDGLGGELSAKEFDANGSVAEVLGEFNSFLEAGIRNTPGHWVWVHKRWRTRPPEDRLSSKAYISWLESQLASRATTPAGGPRAGI